MRGLWDHFKNVAPEMWLDRADPVGSTRKARSSGPRKAMFLAGAVGLCLNLGQPVYAQNESGRAADMTGSSQLCRDAKSGASEAADLPSSVGDDAEQIIEYHRAQALQRNAQEPQRAMAHACLYLDEATDAVLPVRVADAQRLIAGLLWLRGDTAAALPWADAAMGGYQANGDIEKLSMATSLRGSINLDAGSYGDALRDYRKAIGFAEQAGSVEQRLQSLGNIGIVYSDLNDHESALTYYRRAIETQEEEGLEFDAAMTRMNVARALNELDRSGEALAELNRSERTIARQLESSENDNDMAIAGTALPRLLIARADVYLDIDQPRAALADLNRTEELISPEANPGELIGIYAARARAHAALGQNELAAEQIQLAGALGEASNPMTKFLLASTQAQVASALGQYETAYAASRTAAELRDQLREDDMAKAVARAQVEMGVEDLQRQSELDEARAASAELRVQSQQRQLWALVVGLLMLFVLVAALILVIRNRRIAAQALQNNLKLRETLVSEIHHRTKNNLQLLSSVVRLSTVGQSDQDAGRDIANRTRTMALVHEHLLIDSSRGAEAVPAQSFFAELVELIDKSIGRPNIRLTHHIAEVDLRADQATVLGLLASEMITNSYKHAFDENGGEIALHLDFDDGEIALRVVDDGKGFEADHRKADGSIGMQLIEDLSEQAGGTFEIESEPGSTMLSVSGVKLVPTQVLAGH